MKSNQLYAIVAVVVIVIAAAAAYVVLNNNGSNNTPGSMTDAAGNEIVVPSNVETITAASPSIADVVCYLGYYDKIVCVSDYCTNSLIPSSVTSCGSYTRPDSDAISTANATVTFIDGSGSSAVEVYNTLRGAGMNVILMYGSDDGAEGAYKNVEIVGYVMGGYSAAEDVVDKMKSTISSLADNTSGAETTNMIISTGLGSLSVDSDGNWTNLDSFTGSGVYLAGNGSTLNTLCGLVSEASNPVSGSSWVSADTDMISTSLADTEVMFVLWTNKNAVPNETAIEQLYEKLNETAWANVGAVQNKNIVFI
ncbi:MAG: ABC transporter substrate-binding protein, partial [Thermoplasmata archaeon]|nr:ABC transporter substrate-binding protein [Thermoplasmata archaeon]